MFVRQVAQHNLSTMAVLYIIIALVIQSSFSFANVTSTGEHPNSCENVENKPELADEQKDFHAEKKDWIDFFLLPDAHFYPTSSVAMMNQATNSDKPVEEQIEEIKEIAEKITMALQNEMVNLLSYALSAVDKEKSDEEGNHLRERRSTESPMASTQMITRLLKHIKSNNEFQNIAIDKMMTAQEIADKYGIEFCPDTEILADLAINANQQAKAMNDMLQESLERKNISSIHHESPKSNQDSESFYVYGTHPADLHHNAEPVVNHHHHADSYPSYSYYNNYPYETQIPPPPAQTYYSPPVSKRPNFYDAVSYTPQEYPYCSLEPVASSAVIYEEVVEAEPELVGEEFEETVSSKVYVERGDEPGSATVNHVMTYTVGEKSHFRTPEIERLPQQMQYCFLLV